MMAVKISQTARTLARLLKGLVDVSAENNKTVTDVSSDSRNVKPGDLFLAYKGLSVNGVDFVSDAVSAGAIAVIWEPHSNVIPMQFARYLKADSGIAIFALKGLKQQVGEIASRFYGRPSEKMFVFGVTGTNGKTSFCHFLSQALNNKSSCGLIGTLGYGLYGKLTETNMTTPDPIRLHQCFKELFVAGAKNVAIEVSSHALDQDRVAGTVIDVAVFTNLSRDHLDYHGDIDAYGQAKQKIFDMPGIKTAIVNNDDSFGRVLIEKLSSRKNIDCISYGMQDNNGLPNVYASEINLSLHGLDFKVETPWGNGDVKSKLLGRFNVNNLLAVLTSLLVHGMAFDSALAQLQLVETVPGRMEKFPANEENPLVVVDYAHTPDALKQVLLTLREHVKGNVVCVFGCGGDRDKGKRPMMGNIATQYADRIVVTDDNPRHESPEEIINGILSEAFGNGMDTKNVLVIHDRAKAIREAISAAGRDDVVLIAGKGHETYQITGDKKKPFSDREQVMNSLKEQGEA